MKKLVYSHPSGGLWMTGNLEALSSIPSEWNPVIVDETNLPDRNVRDAWVMSNGAVVIDPIKASALQAANSSVAKA